MLPSFCLLLASCWGVDGVPAQGAQRAHTAGIVVRLSKLYLIDLPDGSYHVPRKGTDSDIGDLFLSSPSVILGYDISPMSVMQESYLKAKVQGMQLYRGKLDLYYSVSKPKDGIGQDLRIVSAWQFHPGTWASHAFFARVSSDTEVQAVLKILATLRPVGERMKVAGSQRVPQWLKHVFDSPTRPHYYTVLERFPPQIEDGFSRLLKHSGEWARWRAEANAEYRYYGLVEENGRFMLVALRETPAVDRVALNWCLFTGELGGNFRYAGQGATGRSASDPAAPRGIRGRGSDMPLRPVSR